MRKMFICFVCLFFVTTCSFAAFRSYGPTDSCDNLWQLASKVRPEGVSVQQAMLVLFCANKCSFCCDNINSLAEGENLKIPSSDDFIKAAAKLSKKQAYLEVEAQNREWKSIHSSRYVKKRLQKKAKIKNNKNKVEQLAIAKTEEENVQPEIDQSKVIQPEATTALNQEIVSQIVQDSPVIKERLTVVEDKNDAIQNQVGQINDRISFVEQGIDEIKNSLDKKNASSLKSDNMDIDSKSIWKHLDAMKPYFGKPGFVIGIAGFVIFLIIFFIRRRRRSSDDSWKVSSKDEYNPMENDISAKLNLARAYIDMGKDSDAKIILDEIIVSGNESEQAEAKKLLEKIK